MSIWSSTQVGLHPAKSYWPALLDIQNLCLHFDKTSKHPGTRFPYIKSWGWRALKNRWSAPLNRRLKIIIFCTCNARTSKLGQKLLFVDMVRIEQFVFHWVNAKHQARDYPTGTEDLRLTTLYLVLWDDNHKGNKTKEAHNLSFQ